MHSNNSKIQYVFFIIYFLYGFKSILISVGINDPIFDVVKSIFNATSLIMVFFIFLLSNHKEKLFIILMSFLLLFNYVVFKNYYLYQYLIMIPMLFMTSRMGVKEVINIMAVCNVTIFFFLIPFLFMSDVWSVSDLRYGQRLTYGFLHPNVGAQFLFSTFIIIYGSVALKIKKSIGKFILLIIVSSCFYFIIDLTKTRTSSITMLMSTLGFFLAIVFNKKLQGVELRKYKYLVLILILTIFLFQFYSVINFRSSPIISQVNIMLSNRVGFSNNIYSNLGLPSLLHGVNIDEYYPIDFFFTGYFYSVGWVLGGVGIIAFISKFNNRKSNPEVVVIIVSCVITTMTEFHFQIPIFNPAIFLLFTRDTKDSI